MRRAVERGSALVVSLVIVTLALLLLLLVATRASRTIDAVSRSQRHLLALNAAEAGLARAAQLLARGDLPSGDEVESGVATYRVSMEWIDGNEAHRTARLTSEGACREQRTALVVDVVVPRFRFGQQRVRPQLAGWTEIAAPAE